mgnify:CR=1 FL=1
MPLKHSKSIAKQKRDIRLFLQHDAPRIVGVEAKKHIASNFKQQGFVDLPFKKWQERKQKERSRRAVLTRTGRLKNSIDYRTYTGRVRVFSADVPYAEAHNNGAEIKGTQRVRSHRRTNKRTGKKYTVNSFTREMDHKIPQRKFIGNSKVLDYKINKKLYSRIFKIMNK